MPFTSKSSASASLWLVPSLAGLLLGGAIATYSILPAESGPGPAGESKSSAEAQPPAARPTALRPRENVDNSGLWGAMMAAAQWGPHASLEEVKQAWDRVGYRTIERMEKQLQHAPPDDKVRIGADFMKAMLWDYEGHPDRAYKVLAETREWLRTRPAQEIESLSTVMYFQAVTSFRRGETDNCVDCRGASSCILPIDSAARHIKPEGSRAAIGHLTEYLGHFPDDLEARWLLNLAHMTLGEHPDQVDPRYLIRLERFEKSEFDIGRFRDIGHLVGLNRFNQAGGSSMDDFDNDGRLDLAVTTWDATSPMKFYRNAGDGTFEDRSESAGVLDQLGGLFCVQADYDNDGFVDLFIARGAWLPRPIRPSLLRNNGDGTFVDVTESAGLIAPVNSNSACWADYDNDGDLDLFVCCEIQANRLYRNNGDGTFTDVAERAGLLFNAQRFCKGANWIDFDNDDYPDLFTNNLEGVAQFFRNNRDGTFTDATAGLGIAGPRNGFSCWAFDYDNDGFLDIFATCYARSLADVVKGLIGQKHNQPGNRLYRNKGGERFEDVTKKAGLDMVFAAMGSNFADLDNDGYLDFYLATGEPNLATLVPNRMFKNVGGARFAEITGTSGTGHLQKGHSVSCGDWDRDGNIDIFAQTGGATNGDKYHNILFQNPGQDNRSITLKLVGKKTNRSAIGARLKLVTDGDDPLTIHRHISTGSSFGANPLEQTIGIGKAGKVAALEVHWPTSGLTQTFRDIPAGQSIEITEFEPEFRALDSRPIKVPTE